jgi:hypothetical protein
VLKDKIFIKQLIQWLSCITESYFDFDQIDKLVESDRYMKFETWWIYLLYLIDQLKNQLNNLL